MDHFLKVQAFLSVALANHRLSERGDLGLSLYYYIIGTVCKALEISVDTFDTNSSPFRERVTQMYIMGACLLNNKHFRHVISKDSDHILSSVHIAGEYINLLRAADLPGGKKAEEMREFYQYLSNLVCVNPYSKEKDDG